MKYWSAVALLIGIVGFAVCGSATEKKWGDQAELSFVDTGGNTEVRTLNAKNLLKYSFTPTYSLTWKFEALYGESDGERDAERYFTEIRGQVEHTERRYSFFNLGWVKDQFAGIDPRYYAGVGTGYKFLLGPKHFVLGEAGINYVMEDYTDGSDSDYLEGRLFGNYEYLIADKNRFTQSLEWLQDFSNSQNWRLNSETALISALNGMFSLKTSYVVKYDNDPLEDNDDTDTILGVTLLANF